jgi:hypothetical protein
MVVVITAIRIRTTRSSALDLDFIIVGFRRVGPVTVMHVTTLLLRPIVHDRAAGAIVAATPW